LQCCSSHIPQDFEFHRTPVAHRDSFPSTRIPGRSSLTPTLKAIFRDLNRFANATGRLIVLSETNQTRKCHSLDRPSGRSSRLWYRLNQLLQKPILDRQSMCCPHENGSAHYIPMQSTRSQASDGDNCRRSIRSAEIAML
jgi:hypothetical protein